MDKRRINSGSTPGNKGEISLTAVDQLRVGLFLAVVQSGVFNDYAGELRLEQLVDGLTDKLLATLLGSLGRESK